jgi:hypothetical protein
LSGRRAARLVAPSLVAAAALAACGGEPPAQGPEVGGVGQSIGGSVAPLAQCRDWRQGSAAERLATIEDIRGQLTPQTSESAESGLSDDEAYELFDRVCANDFASSYRLYKVYGQAAAFAPLRTEPSD